LVGPGRARFDPSIFDSSTFDLAALRADIEATAFPVALLDPVVGAFVPRERFEPTLDIGPSLDLRVLKGEGERAEVRIGARMVELEATARIVDGGGAVEAGTLSGAWRIRRERLAAAGVETDAALSLLISGETLAWRPGGAGVGPADGATGSLEVRLDAPVAFPGVMGEVGARPAGARDGTLDGHASLVLEEGFIALSKEAGDVVGCRAGGAGRLGDEGPFSMSASAMVAISDGRVSEGAVDARVGLDPAWLEAVGGGVVRSKGAPSTLRLVGSGLALGPFAGRAATTLVDGLRGTLEVELAGALAVDAGAGDAMLSEFAATATLPAEGRPGVVVAGFRLDGAETRVEQRFARIPLSLDGLLAAAPEGSVRIRGIDPAVVARLAPSGAESIGVLGRGAMTLDATTRTVDGAVEATFVLDASCVDARGSVRLGDARIGVKDLEVALALDAEATASLPLGEGVTIEPGATVALAVPSLVLGRGGDGWRPEEALAARLSASRVRVLSAPGLAAAAPYASIDLDLAYAADDGRTTATGRVALGGSGGAGTIDLDLAWRPPAEARLFRGLEGRVSADRLDLARLAPMLGVDGAEAAAWLGDRGALVLSLEESREPRVELRLQAPRWNGEATLVVPETATGRVAGISGRFAGDVAPSTLDRVAGLDGDPLRRFANGTGVVVDIRALRVPLDATLAPAIAEASIDLACSSEAVSVEIRDASGAIRTVGVEPLELRLRAERLSEALLVEGGTAVRGAPAGPAGTVRVSGRATGLVARAGEAATAAPRLDLDLEATACAAALVDALAGTGGSVASWLGDTLDATVRARGLSADSGELAATLRSEFASLSAPALRVVDGALRVVGAPVEASLAMSPRVKQELLASINPVFADVSAAQPARFVLDRLSWPLDGDRRRFDAAFRLETGDVALTNSGPLGFLLGALGAQRTGGVEARLEPLVATIERGRLVYRDFTLRAGRTQQGSWRNSLVLSGDIDLVALEANAITTAIPLSDAASWSSDARALFASLEAASPELVRALTVGIRLSGPLFDASGRPARLRQEIALPDVGEILRKDPGSLLDAAGSIIDRLRKKKD
ncbi:MAG: hypothetical protein RIS86_947, partial [Planctomycetota bacterium]